MRLLNRLLVFLFVRRKAQTHARAVLDAKVQRRGTGGTPKPAAAPALSVPDGGQSVPAARSGENSVPVGAVAPDARGESREDLIRSALSARKSREAEWEALSPELKSRALAGLGDGMEAIVKTFRPA